MADSSPRRPRLCRLLCEVLEDRSLPSRSSLLPTPVPDARPFVADQLVLRLQNQESLRDVSSYLAEWTGLAQGAAATFQIENYQELLSTQEDGWNVSIVQVFLSAGSDLDFALATAEQLADVGWVQRNYIYGTDADPRELTPNDPQYGSQYHHPLMRNNVAWDTTQGQGVIIAVTDDGVSTTHVDLQANIWVNADEIAGNGIDDDGNGYIDDRNGWDFSANDNDPNPPSGQTHGTHVSGIAAGRTNNGIGIAGTAGQATIMPIRFYGTGSWTSTVILNSYRYAVDNGAKIISTSYNIDGFVGDAIFLQAVNYVYNAGVLHFNSAGNNNQLNPARQSFDQMLFVSSTDSGDIKSSFSNYGFGIDIGAPGSSILSTLPTNTYGNSSGTSMSTPNAAGVAALIWAANPTWNRDQVAAQIVGTADSLDLLNPNFAGLLGSGRVNSAAAVASLSRAPRVEEVIGLGVHGGKLSVAPTTFSIQIQGVLSPTSANTAANWRLVGAGADGYFGTADDVNIAITKTTTYLIGTNRISFTINGALSSGKYRVVASENLLDPHGQRLDGNGDGNPGGNFVHQFTLNLQSRAIVGPDLNSYFALPTPYAFQNIATTGTNLIGASVNDSSVQITTAQLSGFSFSFYGGTYSTLWVSSNGLITFGSGNSAYLNTQLTQLTQQAAIAPFWDNLNTGTGGSVRFQVFGAGDAQELVIQWNNVRFQTGSTSQTITFQAVLREANGEIQFNYLDVTSSDAGNHRGASATIGIKGAGTQNGYVMSNRLLVHRNSGVNPDLADSKSILIKRMPGSRSGEFAGGGAEGASSFFTGAWGRNPKNEDGEARGTYNEGGQPPTVSVSWAPAGNAGDGTLLARFWRAYPWFATRRGQASVAALVAPAAPITQIDLTQGTTDSSLARLASF